MKFKSFSKKQLRVLSFWLDKSKNYDAVICDGAVRSGKTVCMFLSFVIWSFYQFEDSSFAVCGKTIKSVKRNVYAPVSAVLKSMGFKQQEKLSENYVDIFYKGRKNRYYFFGGKDESSHSLIQGMTLSGIFFDEVALMPRSFVEQALARCSVRGSKFWFNCNPEYPGHWFYKEWIRKCNEKNTLYIHFTMKDNPSLSAEMIKRYENLYAGTFYQRFILGKWVNAKGIIYPFMNNEQAFHNIPCEEILQYVVSCDYGTVNPSSFGLWARTKDCWYRIDEYYFDSRKEGFQKTDQEHYNALKNLIGSKNISAVIVDPSAASFIAVIKKHNEFMVIPADNKVLDGIRQVSTALKENKIKICKNCKASIREFSLYRWDESGTKESPVKENDHAMDDIRYFVTTYLNQPDDDFYAFASYRN
ncbi:MAG: PBSX family phage terminase large subunit [Clostridia bacterium]|nr:PBSX family phage terminase large subunit [Clostridia bacterium]